MKVGDKVLIKVDLDECETENYEVTDEMMEFAGKEAVITDIDPDGSGDYDFHLDIDDGEWYWVKKMFTVIEEVNPNGK